MKQLSLLDMVTESKKPIMLFVDGASRGNPGPGGIGIVIKDGDSVVEKAGFYIGTVTNNQAEYYALLCGISLVKKHIKPGQQLVIFSDSQLMVRQLQGMYRVHHSGLVPLVHKARRLLEGIEYTVTHILRNQNSAADALANEGLDAKRPVPADLVGLW